MDWGWQFRSDNNVIFLLFSFTFTVFHSIATNITSKKNTKIDYHKLAIKANINEVNNLTQRKNRGSVPLSVDSRNNALLVSIGSQLFNKRSISSKSLVTLIFFFIIIIASNTSSEHI